MARLSLSDLIGVPFYNDIPLPGVPLRLNLDEEFPLELIIPASFFCRILYRLCIDQFPFGASFQVICVKID